MKARQSKAKTLLSNQPRIKATKASDQVSKQNKYGRILTRFPDFPLAL